MRRLDAGASGRAVGIDHRIDELDIDPVWRAALQVFCPSGSLRPVQHRALEDLALLESRRNLVVLAPTNGGKSLVGDLVALDALSRDRRAVLLEPLRALARERAAMLEEILGRLPAELVGDGAEVRLVSGETDVGLDNGHSQRQLIVATPERLWALFHGADDEAREWLAGLGAVVVDEAHMLSDPRRGPSLELLIATLLSQPAPPRLVLLSASLGGAEDVLHWLAPCDLVHVETRTPPLHLEVLALDDENVTDDVLFTELDAALADEESSALVFVHRRRDAEGLAAELRERADLRWGPIAAYHSGLTQERRAELADGLRAGRCRCLITTTALAMGVNLPATHVFVRDSRRCSTTPAQVAELLQLLGRAGRGDRQGQGKVLYRPRRGLSAESLTAALRDQTLPPLCSSFDPRGYGYALTVARAAEPVAELLFHAGDRGLDHDELEAALEATLGAESLLEQLTPSLRWLTSTTPPLLETSHSDHRAPPRRAAAETSARHSVKGARFQLTALGSDALRGRLPLDFVDSLGRLLRDLSLLDPENRPLARWTAMDSALVISLDRRASTPPFSSELEELVNEWFSAARAESRSMLLDDWVLGEEGSSSALELLGTLETRQTKNVDTTAPRRTRRRRAFRRAYCAALAAITSQLDDTMSSRELDQRALELWRWRADSDEQLRTIRWMARGLAGLFHGRGLEPLIAEIFPEDRLRQAQLRDDLAHVARATRSLERKIVTNASER